MSNEQPYCKGFCFGRHQQTYLSLRKIKVRRQPQFKTSSLLQSPSSTFLFGGGVRKGKKGAVAVAVSMVVTVGGGRRERTIVVFIAIATDIDIIVRAGAIWGGGGGMEHHRCRNNGRHHCHGNRHH